MWYTPGDRTTSLPPGAQLHVTCCFLGVGFSCLEVYGHCYQETGEGGQANYPPKPCSSLTFCQCQVSQRRENCHKLKKKKKKVVTIRLKKGEEVGLLVCTLVKGGRQRAEASAKRSGPWQEQRLQSLCRRTDKLVCVCG